MAELTMMATPSCPSCRLLHHGAAASSSPHSVAWIPVSDQPDDGDGTCSTSTKSADAGVVAYPSHSILNLATFDDHRIPSVRTTLRTSTLPHPNLDPAAGDRIITAISHVGTFSASGGGGATAAAAAAASRHDVLACAFSDGTVTAWHKSIDDASSSPSNAATAADAAIHDDGGNGWEEEVVVGHTLAGPVADDARDEEKKAEHETPAHHVASPTSVADVAGIALYISDTPSAAAAGVAAETRKDTHHEQKPLLLLLVATASVDGIDLHFRPLPSHNKATSTTATIKISSHPAASVSIKVLSQQNEALIVSGTASPRGNKIHVHTLPLSSLSKMSLNLNSGQVQQQACIRHHGSLPGHLDWVTCFDFWDCTAAANTSTSTSCSNNDDDGDLEEGGFLLASGSHDARVRLWRFHPPMATASASGTSSTATADRDNICDGNGSSSDDDDDDAEEDDVLEEGEARLRIPHDNGTETAVTLEALLLGHEEAVTSVSFRPKDASASSPSQNSDLSVARNGASPCLMTSSMDRTILLWMEESDDEDLDDNPTASGGGVRGGAWVPMSRVGAAGGILGGPIGSSLSGFVDSTFSPDGNSIAGHGYGGSLHFWSSSGRRDDCAEGDGIESERWSAGPCLTGHFRGVSGISWDVSHGQYLLSAGLDQTCRLWTEVPNEMGSTWHEAGRPQVHGFDLNALACLPEHRLASGADEKVTRIFEAPKATLRLLRSLEEGTERSVSRIDAERPERAFLPSLGLSNRTAIAGGVEEEDGYEATTKDDAVNDSASFSQVELPTERDLGVITLWPEVRKLFGHHYEVVCLASTVTPTGMVIVASACRARDVENASIMIFEVQSGRCLQVLKGGHRSTVVSLSFSADGQYLASAGRDRRLCLWRWRSVDQKDAGGDEAGAGDELFYLASAVDSAHKRIIWSVHFSPSDPSLLASGARDGFAKIWQIKRSDEGGDDIELNELRKIEPSCTAKAGGKDKTAVTAVAFAPGLLRNVTASPAAAILAIGLESGAIELWSVGLPLSYQPASYHFLCAVPRNLSHISTVKGLAFRPRGVRGDKDYGDEGGLQYTLASCGIDNGVRIFDFHLSLKKTCI